MDKQEVKEECKQPGRSPPEVKGAIRRRQMQAARARMMAAVPTADVVVTNPTHFAVALQLRRRAARAGGRRQGPGPHRRCRSASSPREHGVPIVEDPPLARALYAPVEVGQQIPEEFFAAVAAGARLRLPRRAGAGRARRMSDADRRCKRSCSQATPTCSPRSPSCSSS